MYLNDLQKCMRCSVFDVYILDAFPQPNKCESKPDETRCRLRIWEFGCTWEIVASHCEREYSKHPRFYGPAFVGSLNRSCALNSVGTADKQSTQRICPFPKCLPLIYYFAFYFFVSFFVYLFTSLAIACFGWERIFFGCGERILPARMNSRKSPCMMRNCYTTLQWSKSSRSRYSLVPVRGGWVRGYRSRNILQYQCIYYG